MTILCKQNAFSLVELLVTLAVVGILAGMSIQLYSEYRGVAYEAGVRRYVGDGIIGISAYLADNPSFNFSQISCRPYPVPRRTAASITCLGQYLKGVPPPPEHMLVSFLLHGDLWAGVVLRRTFRIYAESCRGKPRYLSSSNPSQIFLKNFTYDSSVTNGRGSLMEGNSNAHIFDGNYCSRFL